MRSARMLNQTEKVDQLLGTKRCHLMQKSNRLGENPV